MEVLSPQMKIEIVFLCAFFSHHFYHGINLDHLIEFIYKVNFHDREIAFATRDIFSLCVY